MKKANDKIFNEKTTPMFESGRSADAYKTVLNKELSYIIGNALIAIPLEDIFEFNLIYCDSVVNKVMRAIKDIQPGFL